MNKNKEVYETSVTDLDRIFHYFTGAPGYSHEEQFK